MPLSAGQSGSSLATPANVLIAVYQPRAPHCVAKNLLRVSLFASHFSVGPRKHEFARRSFKRVLQVREQCRRDREHICVLPLRRVGIVRASNHNESFAKVHILTPEAEQLAFAHSGVNGCGEQVAPIIGYVKKQK